MAVGAFGSAGHQHDADATLARDLHDLFGMTLLGLLLRADYAHQLIGVGAVEQACNELRELEQASCRVLLDVRAIRHDVIELDLSEELEHLRSLAAFCGMDLFLYGLDEARALPRQLQSVLAVILRECMANVIKHSRARRAVVVFRPGSQVITMSVLNDGLRHQGPVGGTGQRNMHARLAAEGGGLCSARLGGWFVAQAWLPPSGTSTTAPSAGASRARLAKAMHRRREGPRAGTVLRLAHLRLLRSLPWRLDGLRARHLWSGRPGPGRNREEAEKPGTPSAPGSKSADQSAVSVPAQVRAAVERLLKEIADCAHRTQRICSSSPDEAAADLAQLTTDVRLIMRTIRSAAAEFGG